MTAIRKEDDELVPLRFKESPSEVVPVAHNGYKFDFPFLLSECQRNGLDWGEVNKSWRFIDTLDLVRAIDPEVFGGCQKLQCLRHCTDVQAVRAHRALDCRSAKDKHHAQIRMGQRKLPFLYQNRDTCEEVVRWRVCT